jgi:hypothetical protein
MRGRPVYAYPHVRGIAPAVNARRNPERLNHSGREHAGWRSVGANLLRCAARFGSELAPMEVLRQGKPAGGADPRPGRGARGARVAKTRVGTVRPLRLPQRRESPQALSESAKRARVGPRTRVAPSLRLTAECHAAAESDFATPPANDSVSTR